MRGEKSEYDLKAEQFLKETNTKFKAKFLKHDLYFENDKDTRNVWKIALKRNNTRRSFKFGQSINNIGKEPTPYEVLSGLEKYNYADFEDFCSSFGYDSDSRKAEKTFKAVQKEFKKLSELYSEEEIDKLREIQ